jgi:hypothetical protein
MYFPKSQITPNQYTNGGEYVYALTKFPYIGYYFKVSTGKYYTGRNTSDRPNEELLFIAAQDYPDNPQSSVVIIDPLYDYLTNSNSDNPPVLIPTYLPVTPTTQDYQNGEFQRYFCKKTNETQYIEINLDQFTKLKGKDPQILYSLYQPFTITWILTGDKEQVAKTNRNIVELISFKQKLPRFGEYLKFNYLKYYK